MTMLIRLAAPEDADAIASTHVASWRVGYRGLIADAILDGPELTESRRDRWRANLAQPAGTAAPRVRTYVATLEGSVIGFASLGMERATPNPEKPRAELWAFYLHPDHWGSGAADLLIDRAHKELGELSDRATLWVLRDNPRARRFYERNGWSCGTGDEQVEMLWEGPVMSGIPPLDLPLPELQYRLQLR